MRQRREVALMRHLLAVASLVLFAASCGEPGSLLGPVSQAARSPADIVLDVGTMAKVDGVLTIGFLGVPADSRCGTMMECFWVGDAAVEIASALGKGPASADTLHTALDPKSVTVAGYVISLIDLAPLPERPGSIPPDAYTARLRVVRATPAAR
jgi:hypothetical protein